VSHQAGWLAVAAAMVVAVGVFRLRSPPSLPISPDVATRPAIDLVRSTDPLAAVESVYYRGQLDSARALWTDALERARAAHDSVRQARILTWLGLTSYRKADYADARALSERALALKLELRDSADLARSYNALGLIAWNEGRLDPALLHFQAASRAARANGDEGAFAKAANNLALVHTELGEFAQARAGFDATRAAGARMADPRIEGGALANLGMLEVQLGDPAPAIEHLRRARELYRQVGFEIGEQNALGQLGTAYDALGEPGLAFAALDSALLLSRKQGLRQEEASNLELIAGLHRQAGDLTRALRLYREADRLNGKLGLEVERGTNARTAAEIQLALGRADLARPDAEAALRIHRETGAKLQELRDLILLAEIASQAGHYDSAGKHLAAAGRIAAVIGARTARVEVALARAAIADRAGSWREVLRIVRAAERDLALGGYGSEWVAATLRTRAFARTGELDSAALAGRVAVAAVERVRGAFRSGYLRTAYRSDKAAPYDELVDVLLRLGRPADALEIADAARSRALLEHLAAGGAADSLRPTLRSLSEGGALLRRIDTLVSRLDALEEAVGGDAGAPQPARALAVALAETRGAYEALLVQVAERDAAGSALLGGRRADADEIRRSVREGEAVVEYYVAPHQVIAFIVTSAGVRSTATAVSRLDLARRARLVRELLGRSNGGQAADELLTGLHEILVAPVDRAGLLRGVRRLIIVPHSVLTYLPFAALRNAASRRFLVEEYSILTLPSSAVLAALRSAPAQGIPRPGALVLAPFPAALPASRRELRAVRRTLDGAQTAEGGAATERRLREGLAAGQPVHVATHGVMNGRNPMFSRIELARGRGDLADDGRLEVHEVLGLRIRASLVFLSGCETGVGAAWATEFAQGEDYATLAQAFLYAGAGSVVATLWRVADEGAAVFAERFYAHRAGLEPVDALARAQRDMLRDRKYGSPYHWAAYQVSGGAHTNHPGAVER
jgi:CHAT domain-containing protein